MRLSLLNRLRTSARAISRFLPAIVIAALAPSATAAGFGTRPASGGHAGHEFYRTSTGESFTVRGICYFQIQTYSPPHLNYPPFVFGSEALVTFIPGFYDAAAADSALAAIASRGYNLVRVFFEASYNHPSALPPGQRLSTAQLANIADFIARARARGLMVTLTLSWVPPSYYDIVESPCLASNPDYQTQSITIGGVPTDICAHLQMEGTNALFGHVGILTAQRQCILDLLAGLESIDPLAVDSLFSVEIYNEPYLAGVEAPFTQLSGQLTLTLDQPRTYNMDPADPGNNRQALADDMVKYWLDQVATPVKAAWPDLLLSAPTFTPYATGRVGYTGVTIDENPIDYRQGARLAALANHPAIDYVDVHIYPLAIWWPSYSLAQDLDSGEIPLGGMGKPMIVGEWAAYKPQFSSPQEAAATLKILTRQTCRRGFSGWIFFPYEMPNSDAWWSATDWNNHLLDELSPALWPVPCPNSADGWNAYD